MPKKDARKVMRGKAYQALPAARRGMDWFVGDIQGELRLLMRALDEIGFNPVNDRLFCVGDLVDRGPDSLGVLKLFAESPWFHSVLGNHDALALWHADALQSKPYSDVMRMHHRVGGAWLDSLNASDIDFVLRTLSALPMAIELPNTVGMIGIVHADATDSWEYIKKCKPASIADALEAGNAPEVDMLWSRHRARIAERIARAPTADGVKDLVKVEAQPYLDDIEGIDMVFHGHTSSGTRMPLWVGNRVWMDTGADQEDGWLSLYEPERKQCVQVANKNQSVRRFTPRRFTPGPDWRLTDKRIEEIRAQYLIDLPTLDHFIFWNSL